MTASTRRTLLHFAAHLDTWDTYLDAASAHGTPFRRAFGGLREHHSGRPWSGSRVVSAFSMIAMGS